MLKTIDGGRTIRTREGHPPRRPPRRLDRPDEPAAHDRRQRRRRRLTVDGGETWYAPPLPISQFYHVSVDGSVPYRVIGAHAGPRHRVGPEQQPLDGRHHRGPLVHRGRRRSRARGARPERPRRRLRRRVPRHLHALRPPHAARRATSAPTPTTSPATARRPALPLPVDGADRGLARTTRRPSTTAATCSSAPRTAGRAGRRSARDLTRNDKTKQQWSGGPITGDNTGVEFYCTIFAVAESPREKGLIWAGSDDGLVHVTRDGGADWTNVTANVPGCPSGGRSPHRAVALRRRARAYLVVDAHRLDDPRPYLWKTSDYGKTWKSLGAGLAEGRLPARGARGPEAQAGCSIAGTERGVAFSPDDGATWQALKLEPADGRGARPGRQGRRPRGRHARPLDLDPRRPDAAPRVVAGDRGEGGAPVHAAPGACAGARGPDLVPRARARREPAARARSSTTG